MIVYLCVAMQLLFPRAIACRAGHRFQCWGFRHLGVSESIAFRAEIFQPVPEANVRNFFGNARPSVILGFACNLNSPDEQQRLSAHLVSGIFEPEKQRPNI